MPEDVFSIDIFDTSFEGYGVGKLPDGKIIFIPDTVTGDKVVAKCTINKKNFSYGKLILIEKPSDFRINPICPYASECGGCQFMHIKYDYQIEVKKHILEKELNKVQKIEINEIYFSKPFEYRLRVKFRVKNEEIGYFKAFTNDFINIEICSVLKQTLVNKAKDVAKSINNKNIYDLYLIENELNEISIFPYNKEFYGKEDILIRTLYGRIPATAKGFFQSNLYLLDDFQSIVASHLNDNDNVLELFCEFGFFTKAIEQVSNIVTAVDYDKNAIGLAKKNFPHIGFVAANVEKYIRKNLDFDVLVVDPPRKGLSKNLIRFILEKLPEKIIYISCNPMTLTRDCKLLSAHYKIVGVSFLDMFPNTFHIESVIKLEKL